MKSLVIFALVSVSAAFIQDTPEVQAEKQRFYQLFNKAAAAAAAAPDTDVYPHQQKFQTQPPKQQQFTQHQQFTQQQHFSPNSINTFSAPQRQQTFTPHQPQQVQNQQYHSQPQYTSKWTGPLAATVPAGLPGSVAQVKNTPEVEAAIANFNRAFNAALINTKSAAPQQNTFQSAASHNIYQVAPNHPSVHQQAIHQAPRNTFPTFQLQNSIHAPQVHHKAATPVQPKWTGPFAATVPAGLPGSAPQVADTPEVQAAKAQFNQIFQRQLSYSG